jgi:hypothetical protein
MRKTVVDIIFSLDGMALRVLRTCREIGVMSWSIMTSRVMIHEYGFHKMFYKMMVSGSNYWCGVSNLMN